MDPITLATLTSSLTVLGTEVVKGAASKIGEDAWAKIKTWFGFTVEPNARDLPKVLAERLSADPALALRITEFLQSQPIGMASTLVGTINAEKVIVIDQMSGNISM